MSNNGNFKVLDRGKFKCRFGPAGIHYFDRLSGNNILLDEFVPPRKVWSRGPRNISIALTNICDLSCPYCYAPKNSKTLEFENVVSWTKELDVNGTFGVGFGGGEPTLYKSFSSLCHRISECTEMAITFTTHGHHIDEKFAADLKGNVHFIRVSMDGVGSTYEILRKRNYGSFLEKLDLIQSICKYGINYVVNSRTMPDLDDAIKIANDYGASEFLLLPEQPTAGRAGISPKMNQLLHDWIQSYRGVVPLRISEGGSEGLETEDPMKTESGIQGYAHIDATGHIKMTSFDSEGVQIQEDGVIQALENLEQSTVEKK